jgi:hypothetical protein
MPAKVTSKKVSPKVPAPVAEVHDTPHPQVLPRATPTPPPVDDIPTIEEPEGLEEMLENDGDESALEQKNKILFGVGLLATIGLIVATLIVFSIYLNAPKVQKQETANIEVAATPSPTPAFIPSSVSFEVLNGSGVAGAASKAGQTLESKGYVVLKTGNATKQAATEVFISKSLSPVMVSGLLADLSSLFSIASSSGELTDSTATARLIIGTK